MALKGYFFGWPGRDSKAGLSEGEGGGVEWAVVEVPKHSHYFEAEKMVNSKKEGKQAELTIRNVAKQLGLKIFTKNETIKYIKKLDKEANKIFKLK